MPLTWSIKEIKDHETKCWDGDDFINDKDRHLNPVTHQLINITMIIGLNKITENNKDEFFIRIRMYERTFGAFLFMAGKRKKDPPTPFFINRQCIYDHVGLKTNAGLIGQAEYNKMITRRLRAECTKVDVVIH